MPSVKKSAEIIFWLLVILVVLNPVLYFHEFRDASSLPRYVLLGLIAGLGLATWAILAVRDTGRVFFNGYLVVILLLLLLAGISFSWSVDPKNAIIELIQLTGLVIVTFMAMQMNRTDHITYLLALGVLGGTVVSFIGIPQYFGWNPLGYTQYAPPAATFTNKNFAALYLDMTVPIAFTLLLVAKTRRLQWLAGLGLGISLAYLLATHTRGSILALAVVVVLLTVIVALRVDVRRLLVSAFGQRRIPLLVAVIIPVIVMSLPAGLFQESADRQLLEGSGQVRLYAYRNALEAIKDKPLQGTGLGGFRIGYRPYMSSVKVIEQANEDIVLARLHSDPLQMFVELGVVGGVLLFVSYGWLIVLNYRTLFKTKSNEIRLLALGTLMALLAIGVHAWVDFPLHKPSSAIFYFLLAGLVVALSRMVTGQREKHASRFVIFAVFVFAVFFLILNVSFYKNYLLGSYYLSKAEQAFEARQCQPAKANILKSLDTFGLDFRTQMIAVIIYSQCPGNDEEVFTIMNNELSYFPTNTRARLTRGYILLRHGYLDKALDDFKTVIEILPHRESGYVGVAQVYYNQKKLSEAITYLEKASLLNPKNQRLKELIEEWRSELPTEP